MPFNIPILLTWLRVALIPLVVGVYYLPIHWLPRSDQDLAATIVFIVAAITDWFDGFLARRWNQTSAFGAFLDPVADKLMVAGALLVLVHLHRVDYAVAFIIIGREIAISALREWMAQIGASRSVQEAARYAIKIRGPISCTSGRAGTDSTSSSTPSVDPRSSRRSTRWPSAAAS